VQPRAYIRKTAKDHLADRRRRRQRTYRRRNSYSGGAIGWEAIDTGRNGRKGNRAKAVGLAEFNGAAIARRQRLILAPVAAIPDRTDGMNHMPRGQSISMGDFGIAGLAAMERAAFG
jgi:hypothetical protein